jgi:DNA-binding IclR family transcriptional regulator
MHGKASMPGDATDPGRSVLNRALAVLDLFSKEEPEQSLATIQRATGLPSATAYRLVTELVQWGALERVGRGRYRIGLRLWQLGSLAPQARNLRDVALPFLQDLLDATHEVVHLVVLDEGRALYLERLMSRPEVHVQSRVARRLPLHATGPGKVLLAHSPPEFIETIISGGLSRQASGTITDPEQLRHVLAEIRTTGYCLSRNEMTDGASSVAAPVRGGAGEVIASISVVMPSDRQDLKAFVPAVRIAAAGVSRGMRSFTPPP